MSLEKVSPSGEKHGLINTVANSVHDNDFKHMKPETKAKAEKLKKEDNRIVKARYINHRGNNERLTKPYCRWAGDPIQTWNFIPGETYEVPKGLVDEVNAARLAQRSELLDAKGIPTKKDGPGVQIHEFVPISF